MPRPRQQKQPFEAVRRVLIGYGASAQAISGRLGWSYGKAADRLARPDRLTLSELTTISCRFNIPLDELFQAVAR